MEEKRIYYVGIDHGNHLMKTSNHVFENGVERQAVKPTFHANTLVYDGAFYKIGEKRNSVKDSTRIYLRKTSTEQREIVDTIINW